VAFLTHLISAAINLTSPSFELESDHSSAITKALKLAYTKKLGQVGLAYIDGELTKTEGTSDVEITMDDLVAELGALSSLREYETFEPLIAEIVQKLKPFYGDGSYARFFKGSVDANQKSKLFYIYDLDALDADPVLRTLMAMAVMDEITRIIKLPEHRGRMGIIVLEELGRLGKDPTVARYVVDWAETLRKLGYWLIGLTPRPDNYFELEACRALWSVADNFVFLQMSEDNVKYLREKSDILDEATAEIVKSLRTVRGKYADVFFTNKKRTRQGAFRFSQTPLDRWLAPTNAKDALAASEALKSHPGDKWKALHQLATRYPEGAT
jgi:type IV secretory pathway VirB4 component